MTDTVAPPKHDPLAVDDDAAISPRSREELIPHVMEMRSCADDDAEQHILKVGRVQVERELETRWTA